MKFSNRVSSLVVTRFAGIALPSPPNRSLAMRAKSSVWDFLKTPPHHDCRTGDPVGVRFLSVSLRCERRPKKRPSSFAEFRKKSRFVASGGIPGMDEKLSVNGQKPKAKRSNRQPQKANGQTPNRNRQRQKPKSQRPHAHSDYPMPRSREATLFSRAALPRRLKRWDDFPTVFLTLRVPPILWTLPTNLRPNCRVVGVVLKPIVSPRTCRPGSRHDSANRPPSTFAGRFRNGSPKSEPLATAVPTES